MTPLKQLVLHLSILCCVHEFERVSSHIELYVSMFHLFVGNVEVWLCMMHRTCNKSNHLLTCIVSSCIDPLFDDLSLQILEKNNGNLQEIDTFSGQNFPDGHLPPTVESTWNHVIVKSSGTHQSYFYAQYFTRVAIDKGINNASSCHYMNHQYIPG